MPQRLVELSEQQKRCLRFVQQGLTSKEIAPLLDTTPGVIDNYISTAAMKLGATSRREAARLLADLESGMMQQLHLQSERVAAPENRPDEANQDEPRQRVLPHLRWALAALFSLPPMGGPENDLTQFSRSTAIMRISIVAAVVVLTVLLIAVGTIKLLT